jgi:hypothetical protein
MQFLDRVICQRGFDCRVERRFEVGIGLSQSETCSWAKKLRL